jgi:predicted amidohydrolase
MTPFLTAAIQLNAGTDKAENLDKAEAFVVEAGRLAARLVALPEVFAWRGASEEDVSGAEPIPGSTSLRCGEWARRHGVFLLAGSLLERVAGSDKAYNTCLLFDPQGTAIGRYRKAHLFDVELPGQVSVRESAARMSGDEIITVPSALGRIGLSVCYDLRFPELYRALALRGAEIVCVPSAFTFPTGAAHWEPLLRARAIENQVYVVAPNQVGRTPRGGRDYGHSMVVDPWGTVLAQCGETEGVIVAEIRPSYLQQVRREMPCLTHVKFAR